MPVAEDIAKPTPVTEVTPAAKFGAPSVAVVETPSAMSASTPAPVSQDLQEQLDRILDRLDGLEEKIEDVSVAKSTGTDEKAISSLKASIEKLETKVNTLSAEGVKAPVKEPVKKTSEAKPEAAKTPAPVKKKPVVKKSVAPRYELRAAQPGIAWVSESGKSELKSVEVGDTLYGIGKITSISYKDGEWIIEGTQGKIKQ